MICLFLAFHIDYTSFTIVDKVGVVVIRVYMGALMTSLEMAGVSLTLLKMKPEWRQCLGMYTHVKREC